ncbi:MAG: replication initiator protein [Microviridae sp.]|nr:MAG: replication initiator protein [Microviridae sp.]
MPCYFPLTAYQCLDRSIVFVERSFHDTVRTLQLPCGQCVGCRLERSRQWAVRCLHEASLHEHNCFITLTYADESLPAGNSLVYRDFQLFLKRLRRRVKRKVSFYMCGEYGEQFGRPHFHACLFGYDFPDRVYFRTGESGEKLYQSTMLSSLWSSGFSSLGDVTFESAAYVARYVMKKVTGRLADEHYRTVDVSTGEIFDRTPEFCHMSLKPGIGARWLERFRSDVYPEGKVVVRGVKCNPPRFYDKKFKELDEGGYELLRREREFDARKRVDDNTPERLVVKSIVAEARIAALKRTI